MKRLLLLIALGATSLAYAQEKVPSKRVRFLPLGEMPTWIDKVNLEKGTREQVTNPPGSLPPKLVTYTQGERTKKLRLSLRSFSQVAIFPGSAEGILLKEGSGEEGKEFIKSRMPASTQSLAVLFRDNADMTWAKPKMLLLPDDSSAFPAGQIRFVNVSDKTVVIKMGKAAPFGVAPGGNITKSLKVGSTGIDVGYLTQGGGSKSIWKNDVKLLAGQRVQCFFFKAQGKQTRGPVRFLSVPETAPAVPGR